MTCTRRIVIPSRARGRCGGSVPRALADAEDALSRYAPVSEARGRDPIRKNRLGRARANSDRFFYHSIVMPAIQIKTSYEHERTGGHWPIMTAQFSQAGSGTSLGKVAIVTWTSLLSLGRRLLSKNTFAFDMFLRVRFFSAAPAFALWMGNVLILSALRSLVGFVGGYEHTDTCSAGSTNPGGRGSYRGWHQ